MAKPAPTTVTEPVAGEDATFVDHETGAELELTKDEKTLALFGKKQKLKRMFGHISMIGFISAIMVTWAGLLIVFRGGLYNGGPLGLIVGFIYTWVGVIAQTLVLAEMGSMIPISGGQYNFVSVLAPPSCNKILSYITGWLTVIAWEALITSGSFLAATMLEAVVIVNDPTYEPLTWRTLLIAYAFLALAVFMNTVLVRWLPLTEILALIIFICAFLAILVTLVVLSPHKSSDFVFGTFLHGGGFDSTGITFFLGTTNTIFAFIGNDGATHIAEELQNAQTTVPWSMITAVLFNGVLGLAMLIAAMFCLGNINLDLNSPVGLLGYPFMEIFVQATGSPAAATGMVVPIFLITLMAVINGVTTASRMLWAFARERGVPGHRHLARVHEGSSIPLYALATCVVVNALLLLISFSLAAFTALISIVVAAFYSCFLFAAAVMLYKRLTTPLASIRWGPFHLGRAGVPVYLYAIGFSFLGWFFSFWPSAVNPTLDTMNWCVVVYFGLLALAMVYWVGWARHAYIGPVIEVDIKAGGGDGEHKERVA